MAVIGDGVSVETLASMANNNTLAIFRLGVAWAGIWIGGTEFPGITDGQADKMGWLLIREAERLTAIPMVSPAPPGDE